MEAVRPSKLVDVTVQNKAVPQLDRWSSYFQCRGRYNESQQCVTEGRYSGLVAVCDVSEVYRYLVFLWSS
jgi:hypothetical protein